MLSNTIPIHPVQEELDGLLDRLLRLDALRIQISAIGDDLGGEDSSPALLDALSTLERDLTLTARTTGRISARLEGGTS